MGSWLLYASSAISLSTASHDIIRANIDKEEAIPCGKLIEALFEGIGDNLLSLLCNTKWKSLSELMKKHGYACSYLPDGQIIQRSLL